MVTFPPCKINLGLQVTSKRADGYHELVTCFYPVPWCDVLEIIPSGVFSVELSGNQIPGNREENLCVRAYEMLKRDFPLSPVAIHLHKIVPTGAGLGGGSSDAAWTLRGLNDIFNLNLSADDLKQYASRLGSDCSFFVSDGPMLGTGRGEILSKINIDLKGKFLVIVKPEIHISTSEAYQGIKPQVPEVNLREVIETKPPEEWRQLIKNDFERSAFKKHPALQEIKTELYNAGALYASMSGSGSALYGIFSQPVDLKKVFEGILYWSGKL